MKDIRCLVLGHSWKLRRAPDGDGHYLRCQRCAAERDTGGVTLGSVGSQHRLGAGHSGHHELALLGHAAGRGPAASGGPATAQSVRTERGRRRPW